MKNFTIYIKSFTQAEKARSHLARSGIKSIIERTSDSEHGCGFRLRVMGAGDRDARAEVCVLLGQIGIACDLPR